MRTHSLAAILLALPLARCSCPVVPSGNRAIEFQSLGGGTSKEIRGEGMHVIPIWNDLILYDLRVHDLKEQLTVLSSNGLALQVDASVRYRANPNELFQLQTETGPHYAEILLAPVVRSEARKVFGRYSPEEIYSTRREEIEKAIFDEVNRALEGKHMVIEAFLVRDVDLPEKIKNAIADKLSEEQSSQKMQFTLAKERQEADRKKIEAQGIATYQSIVRQGLTAEYLTFKGIEATERLAHSPNTKIVMIGQSKGGLPLVFQSDK